MIIGFGNLKFLDYKDAHKLAFIDDWETTEERVTETDLPIPRRLDMLLVELRFSKDFEFSVIAAAGPK